MYDEMESTKADRPPDPLFSKPKVIVPQTIHETPAVKKARKISGIKSMIVAMLVITLIGWIAALATVYCILYVNIPSAWDIVFLIMAIFVFGFALICLILCPIIVAVGMRQIANAKKIDAGEE